MSSHEHPVEVDTFHAVSTLLVAQDPISFYDAHMALRFLRRSRHEPSDGLLGLIIELRDTTHATRGARYILDGYLSACARRHADQRALAARPILLKDIGKAARAPAKTTLQLHLDENRSAGYRWEVTHVDGYATIKRNMQSVDYNKAIVDVRLDRPGRIEIELEEQRPREIRTAGGGNPRSFRIVFYAEELISE